MFYSSLCDDLKAARCSEMPSFSADYFWVGIFLKALSCVSRREPLVFSQVSVMFFMLCNDLC